jgi:BirA family biotin operon repressor/biotin-[acetyl-CoA-carboxylase] ligase
MPLDIERIKIRRPRTPLHYFPSTSSTMTEAIRLASAGAAAGTVVLADQQTSGMGRLGRSWHSEADAGIYCSILLRITLPPAKLPLTTLLLGLATVEAIQSATDLNCDLRWPNDILINGRKAAGILSQWVEPYVVAGIGINVNNKQLPPDLRTPATSLSLESKGQIHSREELVIKLLEALEEFSTLLEREGPDAILRAFTAASSYASGRRILLEETGRKGTTAGLDADGSLLVRYDSGELERVTAGGVRSEV